MSMEVEMEERIASSHSVPVGRMFLAFETESRLLDTTEWFKKSKNKVLGRIKVFLEIKTLQGF